MQNTSIQIFQTEPTAMLIQKLFLSVKYIDMVFEDKISNFPVVCLLLEL